MRYPDGQSIQVGDRVRVTDRGNAVQEGVVFDIEPDEEGEDRFGVMFFGLRHYYYDREDLEVMRISLLRRDADADASDSDADASDSDADDANVGRGGYGIEDIEEVDFQRRMLRLKF